MLPGLNAFLVVVVTVSQVKLATVTGGSNLWLELTEGLSFVRIIRGRTC
jgi:hypothetical protein